MAASGNTIWVIGSTQWRIIARDEFSLGAFGMNEKQKKNKLKGKKNTVL